MRSLYNRAQSVLRENKLLNLVRNGQTLDESESGFSVDESREILLDINRAVSGKRNGLADRKFIYTAKKKNSVLPLAVNIIALLIVAGGIFLFSYFFRMQEESIVKPSADFTAAESSVISKLKEDFAALSSEKEQQIMETRRRLEELSQERRNLEIRMEADMLAREQELRMEMQAELDREREALLAEGRTEAEISSILEEMRAELEREYEADVASLREQADRELVAKEQELAGLTEEYEQDLQRYRAARERIEEEYTTRISELTERLESGNASAESEANKITREFERLKEQQEKRGFITDQINSSYERVNRFIDREDYTAAGRQLDSLENYLLGEGTASLSFMQDRIAADYYIIDSLRALIGEAGFSRQEAAQVQPTGPEEIPESFRDAGRLYASGQYPAAVSAYAEALLADADAPWAEEAASDLQAALDALISRQDRKLAVLEDRISGLQGQMAAMRVGEETRAVAAAERLDMLESFVQEGNGSPASSGEKSRAEVYSLVQAKVKMKQILNSEEISSQYPGLYESVENYYTAFGEEQFAEGRKRALEDVVIFIDALMNPGQYSGEELKRLAVTFNYPTQIFEELLKKLRFLTG